MKELSKRERSQLERENIILTKAEELYCSYGDEKMSMDELAREANFTKRTLYRYFTCKEDLLFAVALRGYKKLLDMISLKIKSGNTGFEKIHLAYYAFYNFYRDYPQILHLINRLVSFKTNTGTNMPFRQKYMEFQQLLFNKLLKLFQMGMTDKSIRPDLDPSMLTYSSIYTITSFFQLLSASGSSYTRHFRLDLDDFVCFTINIQLDALRNR